MNKQSIVNRLIDYIEETESEKGEISLFSWSHSLRGILYTKYGIEGMEARQLYVEAYNATHPNTPYTIPNN